MVSTTTTTHERLSSGFGRGIATALLALSCAHEAPKSAPQAEAVRPHYALSEYLPPTGLSLAVNLRPQAIFADSKVGPALAELLPMERVTAFTEATGVDLKALEEVWIASYELGTLYLVPFVHAENAGTTFLAHSESQKLERTWAPGLSSYTAVRSQVPYSLVLDAGVFTALSERDPTLGKLVVLRALGKLSRFPSAVARSGFERFPPADDALVTVYWTGPLPSQDTAGSFPAGVEAGRLTLTRQPQGLEAHVWVHGALGDDPSAAWSAYLAVLAERPEFRAILGPDFTLPEGACPGATPEIATCELRAPVEAQPVFARFGRLLRGALDTF